VSDEKKPTEVKAKEGDKKAGECVAPCDPCGKDPVSNVLKCCGSEIAEEAKKANGGKEVGVEFGTPAGGFEGSAGLNTGKITVKDTKDKCNDTETVFFELANMAAKSKFEAVSADAAAGKLSREEYTKAYEKIEYDNVQKTLAAIDKCKKKWGCESYTFSFDSMRPAKDFDDYYKNYVSERHKDYYRKAWDSRYKAEYEKKHPPAPTK
jgi:hypothetical protein